MVPVIHGTGAGLAGLMAYVTHDVENHETAERVEWMEGVNLPTDDAASCERLMRRTVNDAANLKAATGSSSQGRKLRKPYEHLTLSWSPDEPHPTRQDMKDAAREAIKARGYARCQGFIAAHDDRDHPHVHIVICRVDPSTGRSTRATHARKLQRWAETHEKKTRGRLVIPNRRARRLVREHNAAEIKASVKENRAPVLRAMPRMKPRPVRDPLGRVTAPRTDEERSTFNELNEAHRQDGTPRAQARRERVALSRTQAEARLEEQKRRVSRALRTATRPPTQAPAQVNPRPPDVLPPRVFVVRDQSRAPDPPTPVRAAPDREALTARTFVVRDQSTAPDPPTPVRAAPARTPPAIAVRADTPKPPPAPSRPIEPPRPTTTHDSKPVTRGKGRQVGGAPEPPPRPPKPPERS